MKSKTGKKTLPARKRLTDVELTNRLSALDGRWAAAPKPRFAKEIAKKDVGALLKKLSDADAPTRTEAAAALGEIGSAKSAGGLKALLRDPFPPVRQAAAAALVALGDQAMLREFMKTLDDPSPRVVAGAAAALGRAGQKEAVPALLRAFRTTDPVVGGAVARALGQLGDRAAVPWLVAALKSNFIPAEAAEALGRLKDSSSAKLLVDAAVRHPDAEVRAAAARSLGLLAGDDKKDFDFGLGEKKLVQALGKLGKDPSRKVRLCAALALGELGDKAAPAALAAALEG